MTQQDIVNAVNRLAAGYTVTWQDIKFDADKAIYKINDHLGAKYPKMSDVLNHFEDTYSVKQNGKYIPIIEDRYIMSIVVPFIASEILARDEEFTTIYNKYLLEVEDGLFAMFSNEFNRVLPAFRQPDTAGVFFPEDHPQQKLHNLHTEEKLRDFTFRIRYHLNNVSVQITEDYIDNHEYKYNEEYSLLPVEEHTYYSTNGVRKYRLIGWSQNPVSPTADATDGVVTSDIDLYGVWESAIVLTTGTTVINNVTYVYPKPAQGEVLNMENLDIPEYINGNRITMIDDHLLLIGNNIRSITLPSTITRIGAGAFSHFYGNKITLPKKGDIIVDSYSFDLRSSQLDLGTKDQYALVLPRSIKSITKLAFAPNGNTMNGTYSTGSIMNIYCEYAYNSTYEVKPSTVELSPGIIYTPTGEVVNKLCYSIHFNGE